MTQQLQAKLAKPAWPRTWEGWARLYCQATLLFAAQGALLLLIYSVRGFDTNPDSLPLGLQLDPRHAVIHLLFGIIGAAIGFWQPEGAVPFTVFFGLFYIALAIFGTFTPIHFGMQLLLPENTLHWTLGSLAAVVGLGALLQRRRARA
jgi:Domain of unknown function (DUF4383)